MPQRSCCTQGLSQRWAVQRLGTKWCGRFLQHIKGTFWEIPGPDKRWWIAVGDIYHHGFFGWFWFLLIPDIPNKSKYIQCCIAKHKQEHDHLRKSHIQTPLTNAQQGPWRLWLWTLVKHGTSEMNSQRAHVHARILPSQERGCYQGATGTSTGHCWETGGTSKEFMYQSGQMLASYLHVQQTLSHIGVDLLTLWRLSLIQYLFSARSSWWAKLQNSNGLSGSCIKLPLQNQFNPWRIMRVCS